MVVALTLDAAGASCRRVLIEEGNQEREGDDLAEIFSARLRVSQAGSEDDNFGGENVPSVVISV